MTRQKQNTLLALVQSYFQDYLRGVRGASEHTIRAYRDTLRLFFSYLEPNEARAIIEAVDPSAPNGLRDRALLLFLYNTGARVSEALAVRPRELQLHRPRQVRLHGKGDKERLCPLWPETASALRQILEGGPADSVVFRSASCTPLSRDGAAYLLNKYVRRASESLPELRKRRITPHVFRHSCAVALLQAGMDLTVIRDYLGHATIATTNRYVTTNLKMKRDALNAFWKRAGLEKTVSRPWQPPPELLAFLETL